MMKTACTIGIEYKRIENGLNRTSMQEQYHVLYIYTDVYWCGFEMLWYFEYGYNLNNYNNNNNNGSFIAQSDLDTR